MPHLTVVHLDIQIVFLHSTSIYVLLQHVQLLGLVLSTLYLIDATPAYNIFVNPGAVSFLYYLAYKVMRKSHIHRPDDAH